MRTFLWALSTLSILCGPANAAWVWVYDGEKHVVMPPEEGQPPWAVYPDADDDGLADPIITNVDLRVENDAGQSVGKIRVGKTVHLVATPELGALELETLKVTFRLMSPSGYVDVEPSAPLREPLALGMAPAVYRAQYSIPDEPVEDHVGEYEASVDIQVGDVHLPSHLLEPVTFRVVGPRESTTDKVTRKVREGLEKAAHQAKEFGGEVAEEVEEYIEEATAGPPPGSLRDMHERETLGMAERIARNPVSPLAAEREDLALERAAALRSKKGPHRSLLVVPYETPQPLSDGNRIPLGYLMLAGLRVTGTPDSSGEATGPEALVTSYGLTLEMAPEDVEGYVHLLDAGRESVVHVPATAEWFARMVFPSETYVDQVRHPDHPESGVIRAKIVAPLPGGGSVRAVFKLPVEATKPAE